MSYTILVTNAIPREGLAALEVYTLIYPSKASFSKEELLSLLPRCDAVLSAAPITRDMIQHAQKLRVISNYGAGYDNVDVAAATEKGIIVTTCPDSTTHSTAELTLAVMLAVLRRIPEMDRDIRRGSSENLFGLGQRMGRNMSGLTLGIVGMGRIGTRVAELAQAFSMKIIFHNFRPAPGNLPLEEVLMQSDVVSLHCPLTPQTRGLIGTQELKLMKSGAVLINAARGGIVDYVALAEALQSGHLGGAGLDVFPDEPHVPQVFTTLENVVLTPHIGTNTVQARRLMAQAAAERIIDTLCGHRPPNIVNPEVLS